MRLTSANGAPTRVKPQKPIGSPRRSAMPTATTLAEAPTSVPLPPRQAPSASAHHSGVTWGMGGEFGVCQARQFGKEQPRDREGKRNKRRHRRDVVDDRGGHAGEPEQHQGRQQHVAPGQRDRTLGDLLQQPDLLDATDDDEQPDEEEDRRPLHLGEHVVQVDPAHQQ